MHPRRRRNPGRGQTKPDGPGRAGGARARPAWIAHTADAMSPGWIDVRHVEISGGSVPLDAPGLEVLTNAGVRVPAARLADLGGQRPAQGVRDEPGGGKDAVQ